MAINSIKAKPPLEKEITKDVRLTLDIFRIFHWKVWQGLGSKKGVPDIIGILPGGRAILIEVKRLKGKVSDHQQAFMACVIDAGGVAFVVRSGAEAREKLNELREFGGGL